MSGVRARSFPCLPLLPCYAVGAVGNTSAAADVPAVGLSLSGVVARLAIPPSPLLVRVPAAARSGRPCDPLPPHTSGWECIRDVCVCMDGGGPTSEYCWEIFWEFSGDFFVGVGDGESGGGGGGVWRALVIRRAAALRPCPWRGCDKEDRISPPP